MKWWTVFSDWIVQTGLPVVCAYHLLCGNIFLNVVDPRATGLEKAGNFLLWPVHYVLNGQQVSREGETISFEPLCDYKEHFTKKITAAVILSPLSLVVGSAVKGLSYLSQDVRDKSYIIARAKRSNEVRSNKEWYASIGMEVGNILEPMTFPVHARRPGDEKKLAGEKECLAEVVRLFKKHGIVFWVDCGTCLGVYRHEGAIPWDNDIDIAVLQNDFDNVFHALQELDGTRFYVQDWSGRDRPKSYAKVYDRKSNSLIDIYNFQVNPETKTVSSILSNENSIFLSKAWKIREKRYVVPTPFEVVFPLRKGWFDGIEVYVPNQIETYLQMRYGDNLAPVRIYDPKTGQYEKDLSHPYWQRAYVK